MSSNPYWGDCIQIEPDQEGGLNADAYIHHNYLNKNDTIKEAILYGDVNGNGDLTCEWNRLVGNSSSTKAVKAFYLSQKSG